MELRTESPTTVLGKYIDLTGMLYSARLACGHSSLVNLDALHKFNEKLEYEKRKKLGFGKAEEQKKKQASSTRAEVFHEAISKARPSAQGRMREAVLQFQEVSCSESFCLVFGLLCLLQSSHGIFNYATGRGRAHGVPYLSGSHWRAGYRSDSLCP